MPHTLLKKPAKFEGFGPSILVRQMRGVLASLPIPDDRKQARQLIRENCPLTPGIYGWLDSNRQLAYVGKSKCLRKRLLSYFAPSSSEGKAQRIRRLCDLICWEPISHELLALIREQELINRWRPEFNSMGQPTRMQPAYLCVGGSPAPNIRLARRLKGNFLHAFGPITGTKKLRGTIETLNHVFNLRDCPDKTKFEFKNQSFLFDNPVNAKCIRYELGTCPAPCAGMCDSGHYMRLVESAVEFLKGKRPQVLEEIKSQMVQAAAREAFESAAIHRDSLKRLTWLDRRLAGLRHAQKHLNGVLEIDARRQATAWMILRGGKLVATVTKPDNVKRAILAAQNIENACKGNSGLSTNLLEMSLQLIVISWFRKNPKTKQRLLSFDSALQQCHGLIQSTSAA